MRSSDELSLHVVSVVVEVACIKIVRWHVTLQVRPTERPGCDWPPPCGDYLLRVRDPDRSGTQIGERRQKSDYLIKLTGLGVLGGGAKIFSHVMKMNKGRGSTMSGRYITQG
jgi:hypothetical protein